MFSVVNTVISCTHQHTYRTGIKRHQSKHKESQKQAMRLAGLRSDQLGISREPQFQSKKRAHLKPPQGATSFQWGDPGVLTRRQITPRSASPPAVVSAAQTGNAENVETPLAPRESKPTRALTLTPVQKNCSSDHISRASADQQTQKQPADGVNHVLKKKAGLKSERQRNVRQSSEYQRQYQWRTPAADSPLLTAQEMVYSSNRSIPPFKSNPVVMESEYKRCFKGSPPPRGPRLRRDIELNEISPLKMDITPEKSKKKKQRHQRLSRKSSPKERTPHTEPQPLEQEPETPQAQKSVSPKVVRKAKTEYSSNFRSPFQYCYRDGAWVKSKTVGEEVQELRQKAEAYRKRAWGTHFSRQHLSQILSEQNCLWEVSSGSSPSSLTDEDTHSNNSPIIEALDLASVKESCSPTGSMSLTASRRNSCNETELPCSPTFLGHRRKAWDEEVNPCERGVADITQQRKQQPEQTEEGNISRHSENNKEEDNLAERKLSHAEESGSSSDEGRLPTPKLKTMRALQRTHHDLTTPATGGAILVSPQKSKHTKTCRRTEAPLGKAHSPYRLLSCASNPERNIKTEGVSSSRSPPAAGMATVDPLPLREDTWTEDPPKPSPDPKLTRKTPHKKASTAWIIDCTPSHANRIQGTLRNPEFQHNGNLGVHWPERAVSPSNDCLSDNDLDDRMSQISFQSAASCSLASQVLDRAQKRKEDFWGKS
ncbi:nuclear protein MDM1 isoform X2 [Silurus meridionalis]|uniref:nuclear protein MDM1 isoform X2 n=1 Tax=Silurus meridionalis TaxID=175797 RepID=UPI001EEC1353|nr:nuclear protein MDM1 isoform X2 [Silurus meridionalis]